MAKIIVAFGDERKRMQIAGALEDSGIEVFRRCATGSEALRTLNVCHDGVLVCGTKLPDRTADELADDIDSAALMLVIGKPERLEFCESRDVFKLSAPFTRGELASAVRMLLQLHNMRMPQRSGNDRALVEAAKQKLMETYNFTEPQAHRALQRASMNFGIKMSDSARRVLEGDRVFGGMLCSLTE